MSKFRSIFAATGWRIPFFGKGRSPLLSDNCNDLVRALNALGKMEIKRSASATTDAVHYSDSNIVFELGIGAADGGGGASAPRAWYLGQWTDTMSVLAQQVVDYTPTGGQAGTYVCLLDAPVGTAPDTGAPYYKLLSTPAPGVWSF